MTVSARPIVFLWDNLGPNHIDRLEEVARLGRPVIGLELTSKSEVYAWERDPSSTVEIRTVRRAPSSKRRLHLAWCLIRECLRIGKADFFLCHYDKIPVALTALLLRLIGRPAFAMIESKFDDYPRRLSLEILKRLILLPYRGVLTPTLRSRDYMRFLGFRPEQIALGYSALSVDRIQKMSGVEPAPDGVPFAERDFTIVARLVPKKNIAMAIDAFAIWLRHTNHPRGLHLCGSGPLEAELRTQVERLGLNDHVHFHGFVQTEAVSRQLGRTLCLLLPSVEEQFGLVVIEAQAAGLPVLAGRNVGACDVLLDPGINGFVLDPNNPESCAALMLLLSEDEARWRRFATAARDGRYRGDVRQFAKGAQVLMGEVPRDAAWDRLTA